MTLGPGIRYYILMPTLTIPEKTIKDSDLVLVSRKEYEGLLRARQVLAQAVLVKRSPSFRVPKKLKNYYDALDRRLTKSLHNYYQGGYYGPFETSSELVEFLHSRR